MQGLAGKVCVVTGGAKGLGRAITIAFAKAGADVAVISRTQGDLEKIAGEVKAIGRKAVTYKGDISNHGNVSSFINTVDRTFGRIDFLVNNAAMFLSKSIKDTEPGDWEKVISVNLTGTFLITKAVVEIMEKQGFGHIFTISSVGGRMGLSGKSAYCASKFGVTGFSKAISKELRDRNIKVQIVYPYYVDSYGEIDWTEKGKEQMQAVKPEEVADMIVYHATLPERVIVEDIIFEPYRR